MSDKNVYILGAGFSRQLGLPLQDDFLLTAKTVYFKNPSKFEHFKRVFQYSDDLSKMRNYLSFPLLNLENLFNLLEMDIFYSNSDKHMSLKKDFINLIKDVFIELTPNPFGHLHIGGVSAYDSVLVDPKSQYQDYIKFLSMFISPGIEEVRDDTLISFNYDLALEAAISAYNYRALREAWPIIRLNTSFGKGNIIFDHIYEYFIHGQEKLLRIPDDSETSNSLKLIKLHGSINWKTKEGEVFIVPPTWNKADEAIRKLWEIAYKELSDAERIIIIGYSFPETDIYVKSLLALAINNNQNLQNIFFINPDEQTVRDRCLSFIDSHFMRHCEYKPVGFSEFINQDEIFIKEKLNRVMNLP